MGIQSLKSANVIGARQRGAGSRQLNRQAGLTVFEFLGVLLLVSAIMYFAVDSMMRSAAAEQNRMTAHHHSLVKQAVERYQKQNYASILAASASGPVQITLPMLRATGALPASVADLNSHGQTYAAAARRSMQSGQPVIETLLVSTGGLAIGEMDLRKIAGMGDGGGFISIHRPNVVQGAGGTYETDLASFGLAPGGGHVATALFFNEAGVVEDYLFRNAVAGRPEVNRMNTTVDMGGNDVLNARNVVANWVVSNGEVRAMSAFRLQDANGVFNGGWTMSDNTWVRSIEDKNIYSGGTILGGNVQANNTVYAANQVSAGNQVYANNSIYTPGQVYGGSVYSPGQVYGGSIYSTGQIRGNTIHADNSVTAAGRVTAGEYLQIDGWAGEGGACAPNGLVGRDPFGKLLSCNTGVWSSGTDLRWSSYRAEGSANGTRFTGMGRHKACFLTGQQSPRSNNASCEVSGNPNDGFTLVETVLGSGENHWCIAACVD